MVVWKKQLNSETLNTNHTVKELVNDRKLFVWRGKNEKGVEITKESVSSADGKLLTLDPDEGKWGNDHIGLLSVVHESGQKFIGPDGNVLVYDKNKTRGQTTNNATRDTERKINQLISDGDLFVCDNDIVRTSGYNGQSGIRFQAAAYNNSGLGAGHGGKRQKSRKPKRRNSRSNRRKTLNKSKK